MTPRFELNAPLEAQFEAGEESALAYSGDAISFCTMIGLFSAHRMAAKSFLFRRKEERAY
jgi:hypothetical protein